ncbi:uncharacterized protein DS421_13g416790 [Arachis hypogaea]|nr:uncharacterized protein DS421_13g416790 [Arachis hypogaea]
MWKIVYYSSARSYVVKVHLSGTSLSGHKIATSYEGLTLKFIDKWGIDVACFHERSSMDYGGILLLPSRGRREREGEYNTLTEHTDLDTSVSNLCLTAKHYSKVSQETTLSGRTAIFLTVSMQQMNTQIYLELP